MATILKIKRSSTNPTATPSGLGQGELAYGEGTSTYTDAQGATVVSYGKLFVGRGTETNGVAANIDIIGGRYFTDLLDHGHGSVTANSAVIVDSAKKVDEWNVDNITLNGNTLSTTNANGNFVIDTNGTGDVILSGSSTVGDNLFKINDGSVDRFIVDSFSGAIDITSPTLSAADTLLNISSTWNNAGATFYGIDLDVTNTASASTSRLLNLSVGGTDKFNVDLDGNVYVAGGIISYGSGATTNILDNTADAYVVQEGTNHYIDIDTTNNAEKLTLGNNLASVDILVEDDTTNAFTVKEGANEYIAIDTTDGAELLTISTANVDIDRDLNIDGGDLTTNQSSFNLLNTNATSVNFAGAATTLVIGNSAGNFYVDSTGNTDLGGDLNIDGNDLTTSQTTFNLVNATATTVNFAGAATTLEIGAATGTTNINNNLDVDGDVNIDGGDLTVSTSTFNLANTNATTVNFAGAATTIEIGAATGTTNVNNNLDVDGDVNIDGGDLTVSTSTFNLANANATTVNFAGAGTTIEIGAATGTTNVNNNLVVDLDLEVKGGDITTDQTTFNLLNGTATTINFGGAATTIEIGSATGTTNVNNNLDVDGDLNIDGGDLTVSTSTFNLANANATTVNFAGAATTLEIGASTGTTNINNNLEVDGDVTIDGGDLIASTASFNLVNTNATTVNFAGAAQNLNIGNASTEVDFGDLRIVGSTIYSDNSNAQTITIDPYPSGGDQGGNVVIRGNLQVSGTTTTVNSTQMTINDPVFTLGDSISEKTVVSAAASGQPDITLDSVDGLNVGDIVSGNAAIPNGATIDAINGTTITLSANLTAGIAASTNTAPQILTFTQGADDNKDRGIEFKYYNGGLKTGFFGYDESGTSEGAGTTYYFTYIPDATNTSQVFTGTVGSAYFNTTKLEIGINKGIPFFDQYKRLTTTVAAGTSDATTSYQILTVDATGTPVWTTTIDGGTY
jgi:hypothetical protein